MLFCEYQLNEEQLKALNTLVLECEHTDGGSVTLYPHLLRQKRETANNILFYQNEKLVAFLSVYFFYQEACEISILVHPDFRRQKIALQLLRVIMPLLQLRKMQKIIFSMPTKINQEWLTRLGCLYEQSDYHMVRNSFNPIFDTLSALQFRKAKKTDIPLLTAIDNAAFENEISDEKRFTQLLTDTEYTLLIACLQEKIIGKAHIRWQGDSASFSDIAILPTYQGHGFGNALLRHCVNHALSKEVFNLALDVETTNANALNLYLRNDFKITSIHDYWSIAIEKMQSLLQ